jgi:hypothetical protein
MQDLREKVFAGWPEETLLLNLMLTSSNDHAGVRVSHYQFQSEPNAMLNLTIVERKGKLPTHAEVNVVPATLAAMLRDAERDVTENAVKVFVVPRLMEISSESKEKKHIHLRRRFMLLGQTLDGMRVWVGRFPNSRICPCICRAPRKRA